MVAVDVRLAAGVRKSVGQGRVRGQVRMRRRGVRGSRLVAEPDPSGLTEEGHALALHCVKAHPQRGRLLLGDLADVGSFLVGRHGTTADRSLGLADEQPRQVVAVHAPPCRREQVVGQLQPDLERAKRRIGDEAFVSSSVAGVLPVTRFDGRPIGSGRPGPWTQRAREDREAFIRGGVTA